MGAVRNVLNLRLWPSVKRWQESLAVAMSFTHRSDDDRHFDQERVEGELRDNLSVVRCLPLGQILNRGG